jgi:hypothetical protein
LPKADWGHLADICEVDELEEVGVKEKWAIKNYYNMTLREN